MKDFLNKKIFRQGKIGVLLTPLLLLSVLSSDEHDTSAEPPAPLEKKESASVLGNSGLMTLRTLLVDDMEDADSWVGEMPRDNGIIVVQRRKGGPKKVKQKDPLKNRFALGAKVSFFKTGITQFSVKPPREIEIPGITKTLSIWIAGRNRMHRLYAVVRALDDKLYKVQLGNRLNFPGWTKISGKIPASILQNDARYIGMPGKKRGLSLVALYVECAMEESFGTYYFYADQIEVVSDMFLEDAETQDDDMVDDW